MTTLAAMAYKTAHGQPIVYPRDDLNFAENFLYMMFALPTRAYALDPVAARCLEVILMLHADHEQNASTSTVRIAGSSQVGLALFHIIFTMIWLRVHQTSIIHNMVQMTTIKPVRRVGVKALVPGEPLRVHRRRSGVAVGPRARRRQRGGAAHARGDRLRGQHTGVRGAGEGQVGSVPADGVRAPAVQDHGPAVRL